MLGLCVDSESPPSSRPFLRACVTPVPQVWLMSGLCFSCLDQWITHFCSYQSHKGCKLRCRFLGPDARDSGSVVWGGAQYPQGSRQPAPPHRSEAPLRNLLQAGELLGLCIHGRRLVNRYGWQLRRRKEQPASSHQCFP